MDLLSTRAADPLELDDRRLVEVTAVRLAEPRRSVAQGSESFVLHAPLELLARAALLPLVEPAARGPARARLAGIADRYSEAGPGRGEPTRRQAPPDPAGEMGRLLAAIDAEDVEAADASAASLGEQLGADDLAAALGPSIVDRLSAAGHANIYLAQLLRTQPRGLPGQLLRPVADAVTVGSHLRIGVPATRIVHDGGRRVADLLEWLADVRPVGPPPSPFIAPLLLHARAQGVLEPLTGVDGVFAAPDRVPWELLRFAAAAMLQGPPEQAPYGWTHCLTLAQAPLQLVGHGVDVGTATFVALAYLAAHWAGHGRGSIDLRHRPEPLVADLAEAVADAPATAAGAVMAATDLSEVAARLATWASRHHDAHRVKYTLACIDAAAADPTAARLYLAAAAHLHAWWHAHPDVDDPRPELVGGPAPVPS